MFSSHTLRHLSGGDLSGLLPATPESLHKNNPLLGAHCTTTWQLDSSINTT
jgi:hypothetical protein